MFTRHLDLERLEGREMMSAVLERGIEELADVLSSATEQELDDIDLGMTSLQAVLGRAHEEHGYRHCRRAGSVGGAAGAAGAERDPAGDATHERARSIAQSTPHGSTPATHTEATR